MNEENLTTNTSDHWYVYIISTDQNTLYTGITTDVNRRFEEHRSTFDGTQGAKGAKYFRGVRPLEIVYIESTVDRAQATRREKQVKQMTKKQKQQLISEAPPWTD